MNEPPIADTPEPEGKPAADGAAGEATSSEAAPVAASEPVAVSESVAASVPAAESTTATATIAARVAAPAPAPATSTASADIEIPEGFQRPDARHAFFDYIWAAFLGASVGLIFLGLVVLLHAVGGWNPGDAEIIAYFGAVFVAALALALWRGFVKPARSIAHRIGRGIATSAIGGIEFALLVVGFFYIDDNFHLNNRQLAAFMIAGGAVLLGLNLLRASRARARASRPENALERALKIARDAKPRERVGAKPYALAGLIGAGLLSWIVGTIIVLERNDLYHVRSKYQTPVIIGSIAVSIIFAAWRGFPARLRPSLSWGARIFLPLLFGALAFLGGVIVIAIVEATARPGNTALAGLIVLLSLAAIGFGLWRARDPRSEGRWARAELIALGTILLFGSVWPQSAWLRYALGSAEGARTLAEEHQHLGDYAKATLFYQVACERDDVDACAAAASLSLSSAGGASSSRRAKELVAMSCGDADECEELASRQPSRTTKEMLLSRACELGSQASCERVRSSVLNARCDNGDGYACTTLAEQLASVQAWRARELWQKACDFGDTTACSRASGR